MTLKETLEELYSQGKNGEVLKKIEGLSPEELTDEIKVIKAWALFRMQRYNDALDIIDPLYQKGFLPATKIMSQIIAYIGGNDNIFCEIYEKIPDDPSFWNSIAIRERRPGVSTLASKEKLVEKCIHFENSGEIAAIHLMNNTARVYFEQAMGIEDFLVSIGLWEASLRRYGTGDRNLHHRAAVLFWISQTHEKIGFSTSALDAAIESERLWERQVALDPLTGPFQEKLENARKRVFLLRQQG